MAYPSTFVHALIERVRACPPLLEVTGGRGALFDGACGVAFFLLEAARTRQVDALDRAEEWCSAAEAWSHRASRDDRTTAAERRWGLLRGVGGVAYVRILVSSAQRDSRGVARGVDMLASACAHVRRSGGPTSLFDGAAGLLAAIRQLGGRLDVADAADLRALHDSVWPLLAETLCLPIAARGRLPLDLAHGIAGELLVAAAHGGRTDFVRARCRELSRLGERDADTIRWATGPEDRPHALCGGMPGHVYLWASLARLGGDEERRIAELAANATRKLGPAPGASLCCGLAGQAIVHESLGFDWASPLHRRASYARLRRAIELSRPLGQPDALRLWPGALGVGLVAMLRGAGEAHLPCIEAPARAAGLA